MNILISPDLDSLSTRASEIVIAAIRAKPDVVLGLPTGRTPLGLYERLVHAHRERGLDFSRVTTFNLDEYVGLSPDDPRSYHAYMREHLLDHVNIPEGRAHIPDGSCERPGEHCAEYEAGIRQAGGIDMQVLGIGVNGHLGFNEPGASLAAGTHVTALAPETIQANAYAFGTEEHVPHLAVTVGLGTIMHARRCVLMAAGEAKADAVRAAVEGPVTASCPASILQMHPSAVALLDEAAACHLERLDFYRHQQRTWEALADRL